MRGLSESRNRVRSSASRRLSKLITKPRMQRDDPQMWALCGRVQHTHPPTHPRTSGVRKPVWRYLQKKKGVRWRAHARMSRIIQRWALQRVRTTDSVRVQASSAFKRYQTARVPWFHRFNPSCGSTCEPSIVGSVPYVCAPFSKIGVLYCAPRLVLVRPS